MTLLAAFRARLARSLAPTLLFSFTGHAVVAVVGIVVVPLFLRLMGPEAYGLVGFYMVLQGWMFLIDLGLSPAIGRQLSRFRAGALPARDAVSLLRAAETVFLVGGALAGGAFAIAAAWVARHWLGPSRLPSGEIDLALRLAALLLVFRWLVTLYQSALVGLERQIAVNVVAVVCVVARSAGSVWALMLDPSPVVFFAVQAGATLAEALATRWLLHAALPRMGHHWRSGGALLIREFGFAAGVTVSTAAATLIGQADKLTLSHVLPLGDFGLFSLVVSICAGIALVVPPFVQAFQPRLTTLLAQGKRAEFVSLYRLSLALIMVLTVALAGAIAAQPEMVIYAWTGSRAIAAALALTLSLYALGTGISSFLFVPYVLQFAQGMIRLHLIGNLVFGVLWVPCAIWAAIAYGTVGAGAAWLCGNVLFLLIWAPLVHRRLLSPEERAGLGVATLFRAALILVLLAATRWIDPGAVSRLGALAVLAGLSLGAMVLGALLSPELRDYARRMIALPAPEGGA